MTVVTPETIAYQKAHITDDRTYVIYTTSAVMIVLPTVFVALRLACRRHLKARISHDDIAILVALVSITTVGHCAVFGSGRHTILSPPSDILRFVQMEYAIELTYCVLITTIKFSILLFYRRVFINQTTSKEFKVAWYTITVWCFLWGISTFFAAAFQCTPIFYSWTQYTGKTTGKCVNFTALLVSTAVINICTDVAVLVLPMPSVWNLKIEKAQKVAASGIFLLGGFVCIASVIRSVYLPHVVSPDPLWTALDAGIWSIIEPGVGIISASLPSLGPILRKVFTLRSLNRFGEPQIVSSPFSSEDSRRCVSKRSWFRVGSLPLEPLNRNTSTASLRSGSG
ncbi:MAG: hypothetical protein Q9188_005129 [Gyalolechia gomerana]